MYIDVVPNRDSPPAILLRESYRDGNRVRKRTLLNLTSWPRDLVAGFRAVLKGGTVIPAGQEALTITRSRPHGHVAAVLGTLRRIGLDRLLGPDGHRCRDLAIALIASRVITPSSKLATAKALDPATAAASLGEVLSLGPVDEDELYIALDWLLARQPAIETALAKRHLEGGTLVLYDVSSSYLEGRCCELARRGYNRDGKKGKLQIVYGLLCAADGCPVAIEVFDGNTADPATLASQISKLKQRFGVSHMVLVGDRDMAAITSPDFPGERLIVCRNPDLARERGRKRQDLLTATERDLSAIAAATGRKRQPLRGAADIGIKVGAVLDQHKMAKHFDLTITDTGCSFARKADAIAAEAALDGIYVVRTSLPADTLDDAGTVRAYKSLAFVERAFRCLKTVDLQVRPIYHWLADRVRAHVFLCMLAYHVEWQMRARLAPMLYDDADKEAAEAMRDSIVAKAERSPKAIAKQTTGRTEDGLPVHSFQSLLADLATLTRNTVVTALAPDHSFTLTARPTPIQQKAFELLSLPATCTQ